MSRTEVNAGQILDGSIKDIDIASDAAISDSKLGTIATAGKVSNSATTATNNNTANAIVARDATGNFSAGTITAALSGNVTGNVSGSAASFTGNLSGDVTGTQSSTAISATTVTGKALTGFSSGAGSVTAADSILTAFNKVNGNVALKEPTITAGTTAQYWRGDKSWQTLNSAAVGLSNVTNVAQVAKAGDAMTGALSIKGSAAANTYLSLLAQDNNYSSVLTDLVPGSLNSKKGAFIFAPGSSTSATHEFAQQQAADPTSWVQSAQTGNWQGTAWSPTLQLYVAVGNAGAILTSPDLSTWTPQTSPDATAAWKAVIWDATAGIFIAAGTKGTSYNVMTSSNGTTWVGSSTPTSTLQWTSIATNGSRVVLVGNAGASAYSDNHGTSWTENTSLGASSLAKVIWSSDLFLFVAVISTSVNNIASGNGAYWNFATLGVPFVPRTIAVKPGTPPMFVVPTTSTAGVYGWSNDLVTWHLGNTGATVAFSTMVYADGGGVNQFVGVALSNTAGASRTISSYDGLTWTLTPLAVQASGIATSLAWAKETSRIFGGTTTANALLYTNRTTSSSGNIQGTMNATGYTLNGNSFANASDSSFGGKSSITVGGVRLTNAATTPGSVLTNVNGDGVGSWVTPSAVVETDPVVGAVNGIVKANGAGAISAAISGVDYQPAGNYLTSFTETDPVVGAISGLVKSNGSGVISAAVSGVDYQMAGNYQPAGTYLTGPAGSDTQLQFNDAGTLSGASLYWNKTTSQLGINTTNLTQDLTLVSGGNGGMRMYSYSDTKTVGYGGARARGSVGSPAVVQANDNLISMGARGYTPAGFTSGPNAAITVYAAETFTNSANGTYITFSTTAKLTTTANEAMRIGSSGNVGIGQTSPAYKLDVNGQIRMQDGNQGAGKAMISDSSGAATWTTLTPSLTGLSNVTNDAQVALSVGTAAGDLISFTAASVATNVPIGTTGQVLTVSGGMPTWATPSAGLSWPLAGASDSVSAPDYSWSGDTGTGMYHSHVSEVSFATGGILRMTISGGSTYHPQPMWFADGSAANPVISFNSDTNTGIFRAASDIIGFTIGGSEKARLSSTGLGIGTTTANIPLVVTGASGSSGGGGSSGIFKITTGTGATTDNSFEFGIVNGSYAWIDSSKPGTGVTNLVLQSLGGKLGVGNVSPSSILDVTGDINATTNYKLGGAAILQLLAGTNCLAVGTGQGTCSGQLSTFVGSIAGYSNTTQWRNTFVGGASGYYCTGQSNTFIGAETGRYAGSGNANTAVGSASHAGGSSGTAAQNSTFGASSGGNFTTGNANVIVGYNAGNSISTGSNNIIIGANANVPSDMSSYLNIGGAITGDMSVSHVNLTGLHTIPQVSTDHDAHGTLLSGTAGENLTQGDICYMKSDGKYWKANAGAVTTMPGVVLATAAITASATGTFLVQGYWKDASYASWTVGGLLFMSATSGLTTQTAPATSGQQVQVVGYATAADTIFFNPNYMLIQVA